MFDPWVWKISWRRKWQPPPVLLPGKFHGWRSLVGYSPWGRKESDVTERLHSTLWDSVPLQKTEAQNDSIASPKPWHKYRRSRNFTLMLCAHTIPVCLPLCWAHPATFQRCCRGQASHWIWKNLEFWDPPQCRDWFISLLPPLPLNLSLGW